MHEKQHDKHMPANWEELQSVDIILDDESTWLKWQGNIEGTYVSK